MKHRLYTLLFNFLVFVGYLTPYKAGTTTNNISNSKLDISYYDLSNNG